MTLIYKELIAYEHRNWQVTADVTAAIRPAVDPLQLADLLVRAGAMRAMELDINPGWPDFASYKPATANGLAVPSNGTTLLSTTLGAGTFFDPLQPGLHHDVGARGCG